MNDSTANLLKDRNWLSFLLTMTLLLWTINTATAADVYWTNTVGGNWSIAANWNTGTLPGTNDNVFITSNGTYTVTLNIDATVTSLTLGGSTGQQTMSSAGRSINLNGESLVSSNGAVNLSGLILGGAGTLSNRGLFSITSSTIDMAVANIGTMMFSGSGSAVNGPLITGSGSMLEVAAGCVFDTTVTVANGFTNNGTLEVVPYLGCGRFARLNVTSGTLVNAAGGVINVRDATGPTGQAELNAQVNNQGTFNVSCTLNMSRSSAGDANSGTINVTGGVLNINQSGSPSSFTNSGAINLTGGNFTLNQPLDGIVSSAGTIGISTGRVFTVSGGTLDYNSGTIGGLGTISLSSVSFNFTPDFPSGLGLLTTASAVLNGPGSLTNAAGQAWNMGISTTINASLVNNGTIVFSGSGSAVNGPLITGSGSMLEVAAGCVFDTTVTVAGSFTNNGTLEVVPYLGCGRFARLNVTSGTLVNAAGGVINVRDATGPTGQAELNAQVNNQGTFNVSCTLALSRSSAADVNSGTINVTGGVLNINQSGSSSSFTNSGSINVTGGNLTLNQPLDGIVSSAGTIGISTGRVFTVSGGTLDYNSGTIGGLGTMSLNSVLFNFTPDFPSGLGLLTTASAVLNGPGSLTNAAGQAWNMGISTTINASLVNNGTIVFSGSGSAVNGPLITGSGSMLEVAAGCVFDTTVTVAGSFTNNGTLEVVPYLGCGRFARLNVTSGTLVNAAGGVINVRDATGPTGQAELNAQVNNQGTFNVSCTLNMSRSSAGDANSGTINVTGGVLNINQSGSSSSFTNSGSINVTGGNLTLNQPLDGIVSSSGTIGVSTGKVFTVNGGTLDYNGGTIGGLGTISLSSVSFNFTPDFPSSLGLLQTASTVLNGPGTLTNAAGQSWSVGASTINTRLINNATVVFSGSGSAVNGPLITGSGSMLEVAAGCVFDTTVTVAGSFTNNGTLEVVPYLGCGRFARLNVTSGTLVNAAGGVINVRDATGPTGQAELNAQVNNQGTFNVSCTLALSRSSAADVNSGTINVTGGVLNINQSGSPSSFTNSGVINLTGGNFTLNQLLDGIVSSAGTIGISTGRVFTVSGGTLTLSPTSILSFPLSGQRQYGRVAVTGSFQLGGSLNLSAALDFIPSVGDSLRILDWGTRQGGFRQASGFDLGSLYFQGIADKSGLSLVIKTSIVPSPPPATNLLDKVVAFGDTAIFAFSPIGVEPFSYQWTLYGTNLTGQTNASLILTNVQAANLGPYCVSVVDALNVSNFYCATLSALIPANITGQPNGLATTNGATFTLSATGSGGGQLRYQWRLNGENISGATNSSYTIINAQPRDGGTYSVLVANPVRVVSSSNAKVQITTNSLPFADNFAARGTNNGSSGVGSGVNTNATHETGEPSHAGKAGAHSVWLQWTAPASGVATFNTRGSSFDTLLAVYTSTNASPTVTNLILAAADDDRGGYFTGEAVFNAVNGTNYFIVVDGLSIASGDIVLSWNLDTNITQIPRIFQQPLDVTVSAGSNAAFSVFAVSTSNLSYQWYLGDWLAIPGATSTNLTLTNVSYLDVGTYSVEVTSAAGQTVKSLSASLELGPSSDAHSFDKLEDLLANLSGGGGGGGGGFAPLVKRGHGVTAQSLSFPSVSAGTIGSQIINNFNSTTEQGEPIHSDVIGGSSRWYLLTADTNGTLVIDTLGSDIATVMSVYVGSDILSLTTVASDRNSAPDGVRSLVRFSAKSNTNYLIAVDGVNGAQGNINLNWRLGTPPNAILTAQNQVLAENGSLLLSAGVSNNVTSPSYQWRRNGISINGATNSTYQLTSVQYNSVGSYSVLVSNLVGQVINSIATVSVQSPLRLGKELGGFRASGSATQGIVLQLSSNLTVWTPLYTNTSPLLPVNYLDTNSATQPKGFYRLQPWP